MEKAKGSVAVAGGVKVYTSHYLLLLLTLHKTTMGGRVQTPLRKTARCIRDVISIVACSHCARWLWSFQREFGFNWNTLTMIIVVTTVLLVV